MDNLYNLCDQNDKCEDFKLLSMCFVLNTNCAMYAFKSLDLSNSMNAYPLDFLFLYHELI